MRLHDPGDQEKVGMMLYILGDRTPGSIQDLFIDPGCNLEKESDPVTGQ
jgi:hypothetical protein